MQSENGQTGNPQSPTVVNSNEAPVVKDPVAELFRLKLQNFTQLINRQPPAEAIGDTPDGKAQTLLISHIEAQLDMAYFGLWSTENFKWSVIANEVVGSIDLLVFHPVAQVWLRRVGAAAIQIQVDKVPDNVKADPKARNAWANDPANKKPAALDMGFPKLKAECLKNAANSLGKVYGRDLNRDPQKTAQVKTLVKDKAQKAGDQTDELLKSKNPKSPV